MKSCNELKLSHSSSISYKIMLNVKKLMGVQEKSMCVKMLMLQTYQFHLNLLVAFKAYSNLSALQLIILVPLQAHFTQVTGEE